MLAVKKLLAFGVCRAIKLVDARTRRDAARKKLLEETRSAGASTQGLAAVEYDFPLRDCNGRVRDSWQDSRGALKTRKPSHFPSIPFAELPSFLIDQSSATAQTRLALDFGRQWRAEARPWRAELAEGELKMLIGISCQIRSNRDCSDGHLCGFPRVQSRDIPGFRAFRAFSRTRQAPLRSAINRLDDRLILH
jgi:hypothetical protein